MKIALVLGTRPEIIKMCSVIRECEKRKLDYFIVHSGQHYSYEMDKIFFEELYLPKPKYNLEIGSAPHGNQTGNIMIKLEPILEKEKPDIMLAQGDTNTVLAAALASAKLGIKVGHIEAGLRSYDRTMPEETNRVVTDHISDFLFPPTDKSKNILRKEGIDKNKIFVVGNTVVDALNQNIEIADKKADIREKLGINGEYILITAHRANNVDIHENLIKLLDLVDKISKKFDYTVVWPVHPRTIRKINEHKLYVPKKVMKIDPLGYLDFLQLEKNAKIILTDSGGIQEEACILGVPCLTLRENTERPESVEVGANKIIGLDANKALTEIDKFLKSKKKWENPFGNGRSGEKIINIISKNLI